MHILEHLRDFCKETNQSPGSSLNDQVKLNRNYKEFNFIISSIKITEAYHQKVEAIRMKGNQAPEPDRNTVYGENLRESANYRNKSTDIFVKANEATLATIADLKPFASARSRRESMSSNLRNCTLNE